ncbi:branched-chain amino acid ABC transporter substrate-binding protein [Desulfogranum mediterraneum]|uniref:branched-chain amino acid ABC transporter substrate-binding protein n=1 Tax=Desulfogranum mediterraneum TaxID=160661 RepID=UPI000402FC4A|nr:branched-chain amino acid ABC transporter substrate-binding protein [Desulfogranum mediterraneum]
MLTGVEKRCWLLIGALLLPPWLSSCSTQDTPPLECSDPLGCVRIAPEEPVQIGVLQALKGQVAPLGEAQLRGLELALAARGHRLLDHQVVLQIEDTGCTAEGGANAALKVIADPQTVAIFGTTCSGAAATAAKAMSSANLTMVSGNNSAPYLTSIGGEAAPGRQPGYFRTATNEENAGKAAAGYLYHQLGLRRAATINDNDIYTRGLTKSFKKAFLELGGELVLETSIHKGDRDMVPVLTAVARSGAQLLFFPLFQPEGNRVLLQARKIEALQDIVLISDGALIEQSFLDDVGVAAEGLYFIGPRRPEGPRVEQLDGAYRASYGEAPRVSYYLSGYEGADLLFHAIEQCALSARDGSLLVGRQALRDTLHAVRDYEGLGGSLSCDRFGDCSSPAFNVLRLDDHEQGLAGLERNVLYSWKPAE